ncbi:MAG: hypothetical protein K2I96_20020 [Lachnospiraceae bacterium]|nr:hypothetical protein [Lachnospiraceae bacterium]
MLLQKIILTENTDGLYSRSRGKIEYKNDSSVIFGQGAEWSADTYLNAFSIGKWCTYCDLKKVSLKLSLKGIFMVRVVYAYANHKKVCRKQIAGGRVEAAEGDTVQYDIPLRSQGVVCFSLQAVTDGAVCSGAFFEGEAGTEREITIALNICTYKREKYLMRNLELLRKSFLENESSALYGHLQVFITDNGNTLPIETLRSESVHICYNPNVGGAGGFARGLIEIEKVKQQKNVTHVIFMDDDVEILPEGLIRTYTMLRCLKEQYGAAFIAGAMLRLDEKYIQHENGAVWNGGMCQFANRGIDLRRFSNVVLNDVETKRDYAAWWYCCIPAENVRSDNLPIPVFIHEDDVEYSLRNARGIITMNGIAVWHPVAANKRMSSNEYYNLRNMLIVNARYCPGYGGKRLAKTMAVRLLMALLRYRYRDMHLLYQALVDFCRGPEWLLQVDAPAYHQEIIDKGYKMTDVSEKLRHCPRIKCSDSSEISSVKALFKRAFRQGQLGGLLRQIVTLNGWILPPVKETRAVSMGVHPIDLYRTGSVILYDDESMQGIEVRRSFRQIFVFLSLYVKSLRLICTKYDRSKQAYRAKWASLHGISYWRSVYER